VTDGICDPLACKHTQTPALPEAVGVDVSGSSVSNSATNVAPVIRSTRAKILEEMRSKSRPQWSWNPVHRFSKAAKNAAVTSNIAWDLRALRARGREHDRNWRVASCNGF
jgi:hypothetical protein